MEKADGISESGLFRSGSVVVYACSYSILTYFKKTNTILCVARVAPESIATHNVATLLLMSVLMEIKMNLTGKKFNTLTVLSEYTKGKHTYCVCQCDCGKIKNIRKDSLGKTRSCGCLSNNINGLSKTRLHRIWVSMHTRCECKTHKSYNCYKNIKICDEWHTIPNRAKQTGFLNFYEWAINNGYSDKLTLDRIDNDKGYYPDNCRWITNKEQQRNKKQNVIVEYRGEKHCVVEWCEILNLKISTVRHTVERKGFTWQQAFDRHLTQVFNVKKQCWEYK